MGGVLSSSAEDVPYRTLGAKVSVQADPMASPQLPRDNLKYANMIGASPHHGETHIEKRSPLSKVFYNMVNSVVGAGIVGLPYVFKQSGLLVGSVCILVTVFLTDYTLRLLIEAAKLAGAANYEQLCEVCFGDFGYYIVSLAMFIMDYGAMLTYLLIMADSSLFVVEQFFDVKNEHLIRAFLIIGLSSVFILPWCLCRDMSGLEKASTLSVGTVVIIISIVTAEYFTGDYKSDEKIAVADSHWLSGIGTLTFAFVCHDCAFLFYQTLEKPTSKRWSQLTFRGLSASMIINFILTIFGYLTFLEDTDPNILNNYKQDDVMALVARVLYTLTMCLTYPIGLQVTRHVLYAVIYRGNDYVTEKDSPLKIHLGLSLSLFVTTVALACFIYDLGLVMSLTGSLSACALAFVLPTACWLKLCKYRLKFWQAEDPWKHFIAVAPKAFVCVGGFFLAILSATQTILNACGIDAF